MTTEYRIVTPGYLESAGFALRAGPHHQPRRPPRYRARRRHQRGARPEVLRRRRPDRTADRRRRRRASRIVGVVANAVERHLTERPRRCGTSRSRRCHGWTSAQSLVLDTAPGVDEAIAARRCAADDRARGPGVAVQQTTTMGRVLDKAIGPARQVVLLLSLLTRARPRAGRGWRLRCRGALRSAPPARLGDSRRAGTAGRPGHRACRRSRRAAGGGGDRRRRAGAALLARLLSSLLYGVHAIDPIAFAAAGAALLAVGMLAAFIPAWRAGMTDPAIALREQ